MHAASGLHTTQGTAFCGPSAIAAITGLTPEHVEEAVMAQRKLTPIVGRRGMRDKRGRPLSTMWSCEIVPVVERLGWNAVEYLSGRPTFGRFIREHNRATPDTTWLVLITEHYVAISGAWFADSMRREPIRLAYAPYKRKRVVRYWRITAM